MAKFGKAMKNRSKAKNPSAKAFRAARRTAAKRNAETQDRIGWRNEERPM